MSKAKLYTRTVTLPNGKRKYYRAKTKAELDKKITQAKLELGAGVDIANDITFGEYAQMWYTVYKKPYLRENSQQAYKHYLNNHILPVLTNIPIRNIKPAHIQKVMEGVKDNSHSLQSAVLMTTRAVFRSAVDNGVILKTPATSTIKSGGRKTAEKVPLTPEQSEDLLKAMWGKPEYLFCLIALSTGMRRGEIFGLMWDDVDFENGYIEVTHNWIATSKTKAAVSDLLKTEASHRRLPMPNRLSAYLALEKQRSGSPYVIHTDTGDPVTYLMCSSIWYGISSTAEKLGAYVTPHILRHTYITRLFEAGLDIKQIQYLAGHSTPEMTLRIYTHYCRASREEDTAKRVREAALPSASISVNQC